jgi:predicted phage terminase large subunit-like protein
VQIPELMRPLLDAAGGDPERVRQAILSMEPDEAAALWRAWRTHARPEQCAPEGDWSVWLVLAGRGSGKTRAAAEWVTERLLEGPLRQRGALIGQTLEDVRLVMVEGESGLLRCLPPSLLVNGSVEDSWNRGPCELTLSNGSSLKGFSSERPGRLRGPQHHFVWGDEPAEWRDARLGMAEDTTIANALIGCRLPPDPRVCLTGTPKGVRLIRELLVDNRTAVTRMTTYDNLGNLAPEYRERILDRYEGTRLGRQELMGELLEDAGGMFARDWIRLTDERLTGRLVRAWDLAATEPSDSNPDPDWTVGALVCWNPDVVVDGRRGVLQVQHVARWRLGPGETQDRFVAQCREDGLPRVLVEQEPGSSGKSLVEAFARAATGHRIEGVRPTGPKEARAEVWASLAEQGRVSVLAGPWVTAFLDECDEFPLGAHDDQVDAVSLAVSGLLGRRGTGRRPRQPEARLPVGTGPRVSV